MTNKLSRRDFLKGIGGLTALAVMPPMSLAPHTQKINSYDIIPPGIRRAWRNHLQAAGLHVDDEMSDMLFLKYGIRYRGELSNRNAWADVKLGSPIWQHVAPSILSNKHFA